VLEHVDALDGDDSVLAALAFLAGQSVDLPEAELNAALRRALLVLAAGGDPHRELAPDAPSTRSLADDHDAPDRRAALVSALGDLRADADGLERVPVALARLRADPDLAWRWLACALLAAEVADEGSPHPASDPSNE
jgi:hypothetical protein